MPSICQHFLTQHTFSSPKRYERYPADLDDPHQAGRIRIVVCETFFEYNEAGKALRKRLMKLLEAGKAAGCTFDHDSYSKIDGEPDDIIYALANDYVLDYREHLETEVGRRAARMAVDAGVESASTSDYTR